MRAPAPARVRGWTRSPKSAARPATALSVRWDSAWPMSGTVKAESDAGYVSVVCKYRARHCNGMSPARNVLQGSVGSAGHGSEPSEQRLQGVESRRLQTSGRSLYHPGNGPVEPEAVFGDIKFNQGFKRFRLRSHAKVSIEFGLVALARNMRKRIAVKGAERSNAVCSCSRGAPHCKKKRMTFRDRDPNPLSFLNFPKRPARSQRRRDSAFATASGVMVEPLSRRAISRTRSRPSRGRMEVVAFVPRTSNSFSTR